MSPPSTTLIGAVGQRTTGVGGPTCTCRVISESWPDGSCSEVPSVTWNAIAAGPS
jgi:hypothetical protein